jgi:drug/metabolite transporter (DMT)-like permease
LAKQSPLLGVILALGAAMFFGLNASTSKVIVAAGIDPGSLVLFRSLACALLAALALLMSHPNRFRIRASEIPRLLVFGIVGVALMQWAYSNAVSKLPVGIALLIEYTAVIWVPLTAKLLWHERTKPRLWLGVVLVLAGLVAISQIWNVGLDLAGLGFAALAAVLLTTFFLMGEHTQQSRDTLSTLFYTMLISSLFWLIFSPWWNFDFNRLSQSVSLTGNLASTSVPFAVLLIWIGVAGSFIPMLLSYAALRVTTATGVGIASTAEVVFAALFGWYWLGEQLDGLQLVGGGLLIAGIVVAQTSRQEKVNFGND